ncbi:MAG: S41 family peptidase [Chloroflexota bacterium]|nr:S41 family peptidase [Chloroflexota bacterium]
MAQRSEGPLRAGKPGLDQPAGADGLNFVHYAVRMTALFLLVLIAGFGAGLIVERSVLDPSSDDAAFQDLEAVSSLIEDNYYYRPTESGAQEGFNRTLEQHAIGGMLTSLDDEYTRYLMPDAAQVASEELQGEYGGVGVKLEVRQDALVINRISPEGPAARAGVEPGGRVLRIDNRPVRVGTDTAPTGDLRGPIGSSVTLTIGDAAGEHGRNVVLEREAIVVHPVSFAMIDRTSFAWIKIDIFGDRTVLELDGALATARESNATGIILDLRGNGGGWVTSAQETIGRFVDHAEGPALYEDVTPGRGGEVALPILNPESGPSSFPMIVLVDGRTASAAEIVAGSLRDYDRALVVGAGTFGKGSVQRIFDFQDGASLRVTVAEWFTPSKGRIQDEGIQPDVVVNADGTNGALVDPLLQAAGTLLDQGITRPTDLAAMTSPVATPPATPVTQR